VRYVLTMWNVMQFRDSISYYRHGTDTNSLITLWMWYC